MTTCILRAYYLSDAVITDRILSCFLEPLEVRKNRRVPWRYAIWGGRWHSVGEVLSVEAEHMDNNPYEYRIVYSGGVVAQYLVN